MGVDDRVDRLTLVVEAMWELLEESGYSEEALQAKVEEIDGRDGRVDGKVTRQPTSCHVCGSASPSGRTHCQMCGEEFRGQIDTFGSI